MLKEVTQFQLDTLLNIGCAGARNGAEALSMMMEKNIGMSVPSIKILPFSKVSNAMGGPENVVTGVFLTVESEAPCNLLFIFPLSSAKFLAGHLVEQSYAENEEIDFMGKSALCEVGNVVAGAYLKSLSDFTHLDFIPSVPALAIDMAGAVLDSVLAQVCTADDQALLMETVFSEIEQNVTGHLFLLPEQGSLTKIVEAIGVKG